MVQGRYPQLRLLGAVELKAGHREALGLAHRHQQVVFRFIENPLFHGGTSVRFLFIVHDFCRENNRMVREKPGNFMAGEAKKQGSGFSGRGAMVFPGRAHAGPNTEERGKTL